MIADERLLALCECTEKIVNSRQALHYIHVKDNMAEATDRYILARTTFNTDDSQFPATSGELIGDDDILLSVEQVKTAFKSRPKTKRLSALQNVKIAIDRVNKKSLIITSDGHNETVSENVVPDETFPETKTVYPFYSDEKSTLFSISAENLGKLCKMAKKANSCFPYVTFQVPHSEPEFTDLTCLHTETRACSGAIKYIIEGDGNIIKGVVMPVRVRADEISEELNQDF